MKAILKQIGKCNFLLLLAVPGNALAQDLCEIHIFPTNKITSLTKLGNYGPLTEFLAGQGAPEGMILRDLPLDAQFEATKSIFARNTRFAGYHFILADKVIDYKSATKNNARLTTSTANCYAELVLADIVFSHSALTNRKIGVMPVLREFSDNFEKPRVTKMGGAWELQVFPTTDHLKLDEAKNDLLFAFRSALQQSMDKFLKPKR